MCAAARTREKDGPLSCILSLVKTKKPAVGRAKKPAVGRAKKPASGRARIEKDLKDAIAEIDEQGLLFLLRQAQVLIHNARVDQLSRDDRKTGDAPRAERAPEPERATVSIEQPEPGKTIFLTLGKSRKVLTPEEMKRLVRICYSAETKSEALRQLFTVMAKERKDILADAMIGHPDNPLLVALFTTIRETYRLEDR
jgi:hypothetical protein